VIGGEAQILHEERTGPPAVLGEFQEIAEGVAGEAACAGEAPQVCHIRDVGCDEGKEFHVLRLCLFWVLRDGVGKKGPLLGVYSLYKPSGS